MLTSKDRWSALRFLDEVRANYRPFYLCIPDQEDCPNCGFDELTQSAKDITCATCGGLGRITTWTTMEVRGRIQYYDFVTLSAAGIPPGIEIGDAVTYTSAEVKEVIKLLMSKGGYALIDGNTFAPFGVAPTGVGQNEEWRTEWKKQFAKDRAEGY